MEENKKKLRSIWGNWWEPIRKWFYPAWLIYETSIRFYDYALSVQIYFAEQQIHIAPYIGEIGAQTLAIFIGVSIFTICTVFLTVPASLILYKFFKTDNLTNTQLEVRTKIIF